MQPDHEEWETRFAANVRRIRQERGWSLQDMADRLALEGLNLHRSAVAKLETAQRPIRISEAAAIAAALGIPPLSAFYPAEDDQLEELQKELMRAQKALDAAESKLGDAGFSYTSRYREVREAAAKLIAANHQRDDEAGTGAAAELPPRIRDNLFAAGGYPLDDYGPD